MRRRFLDSLELAHFIVDIVEDKKAEDILLLDLRPDAVIADFFVICTGNSDRQLKALIDHVRIGVKERYQLQAFATEGEPASGWVLLDYGDVIVHMFMAEERRYYDLEGFWKQANILLSIQ